MGVGKKYLKNVNKLFMFPGKEEKGYLNDLKRRVNNYAEDFPEANYNEYVEHFGEPKDNLIEYYENTDVNLLMKRIAVKKYLMVGLVASLVVLAIFTTFIYKSYVDGKKSYVDHVETIVTEGK